MIRGNLGYLSIDEEDNIKRDFSGMELEGMDWINLCPIFSGCEDTAV